MKNIKKQKNRTKKSIARRKKEIEKEKLETAWRNIWVKAGILNG
jgi:hypothetical protein